MNRSLLDRAFKLLDKLKDQMTPKQLLEFSQIKEDEHNSYYAKYDNYNYD